MNSQNISAKESEESKMEKITSFTIDHIKLQPGIYVSRKDPVGGSMITTFDIRMTSPNEEPVMNTAELHTIEHLAATFLRNHKEFGSKMIYWGPMGCRTGNYLLLNGDYESKDIVPLMIETFEFIRDFEGEVPGASAKDCGNFWMKFFMISSRTDLFIHSNILQYYSNPHKQHTEKDFYRIFQTKKVEADRSLSPAASAFTYTFLSTFFQKSLYCNSHRNLFKED